MAMQGNRDDHSQVRRSDPSVAAFHALSLGQVRLHDPIVHLFNRSFLAARIGL